MKTKTLYLLTLVCFACLLQGASANPIPTTINYQAHVIAIIVLVAVALIGAVSIIIKMFYMEKEPKEEKTDG